jgi:manganese-dependent inorganic pyrophosphatase
MNDIYIFGHKKPDTDSVTSAIALSYLKNRIGMKTKPMVLGKINKETEFVLNYFKVEVPELLEDVKLQLKDVNYHKDCFVNELDSIINTYNYMTKMNITGVPIVDSNNKLRGLLTSKMIGEALINGNFTKLNTSYDNILEVLKGEEILKFDDEIIGNIIAAAFRSTTILNTTEFREDTIMIIGDRHSIIEAAVNSKIKLLIIVGNLDLKEEHLEIARQNRVNIIRTHYDTFHTAKLINLSNYVKNLIADSRNISFNENDYYDDFKRLSAKLGHNNYPVVDNSGKCLGLIRITDINKMSKKQVILVDHNDINQSVEGLEEAEVLEIVDHHNLGSLTTNMPINFRNMTVGSTNTILYSLYNENNVAIPPGIAGLMLSGIISDTLKFTSPTTTEYDKFVAQKLSLIANIYIDDYASRMFKAGTDLNGKSTSEIIQGDIKTYEVNGKKIAISQVITLASDEALKQKDEYIKELNHMKEMGYDVILLSITDILKDGSYIFFNEESKDIIASMFGFENIEEGYFFNKCLSRKKQLVPLIMSTVK